MKKSKGNQKVTKRDGRVNSTFKAVTIGPIVTMAVFVAVYLVWWGISKVFYSLHGLLTESVFPWIAENWLVSIVIWIFLAVTASIFTMFFSKEKSASNASAANTTSAGTAASAATTSSNVSGKNGKKRTAPGFEESDEEEVQEVEVVEIDPNSSDVYISRRS